MVEMIPDIASRTRELVELLRTEGIGGVRLSDVEIECEEDWSADYAIICELHGDFDALEADHDYVDHSEFYWDVQQFIEKHFASDPTVRLTWHGFPYGCQELEVTRITEEQASAAKAAELQKVAELRMAAQIREAAPDLLAACQAVVLADNDTEIWAAQAVAAKAIAKATKGGA
jgi:hypothetical protein